MTLPWALTMVIAPSFTVMGIAVLADRIPERATNAAFAVQTGLLVVATIGAACTLRIVCGA